MFTEHIDHYEFPLHGAVINHISIGNETELSTAGSIGDIAFVLYLPYTIDHDGTHITIDPEQPDTHAPVLALLHRPLLVARAYKSGRLEIDFEDGRRLISTGEQAYEAWHIHGRWDFCFISLPGGGLTTV